MPSLPAMPPRSRVWVTAAGSGRGGVGRAESQNHRNIWVGKDLLRPCQGHHKPLSPSATSRWLLNPSRDGEFTLPWAGGTGLGKNPLSGFSLVSTQNLPGTTWGRYPCYPLLSRYPLACACFSVPKTEPWKSESTELLWEVFWSQMSSQCPPPVLGAGARTGAGLWDKGHSPSGQLNQLEMWLSSPAQHLLSVAVGPERKVPNISKGKRHRKKAFIV